MKNKCRREVWAYIAHEMFLLADNQPKFLKSYTFTLIMKNSTRFSKSSFKGEFQYLLLLIETQVPN